MTATPPLPEEAHLLEVDTDPPQGTPNGATRGNVQANTPSVEIVAKTPLPTVTAHETIPETADVGTAHLSPVRETTPKNGPGGAALPHTAVSAPTQETVSDEGTPLTPVQETILENGIAIKEPHGTATGIAAAIPLTSVPATTLGKRTTARNATSVSISRKMRAAAQVSFHLNPGKNCRTRS